MHIHFKKATLLFFLSLFFVGQIVAEPRGSGIPSALEKPWHQRHKKPLMVGAVVVVIAGLIYNVATQLPLQVTEEVTNLSNGVQVVIKGQNFRHLHTSGNPTCGRELLYFKNGYEDAYYTVKYWNCTQIGDAQVELRRQSSPPSFLTRLTRDISALSTKIQKGWSPAEVKAT